MTHRIIGFCWRISIAAVIVFTVIFGFCIVLHTIGTLWYGQFAVTGVAGTLNASGRALVACLVFSTVFLALDLCIWPGRSVVPEGDTESFEETPVRR